MFNKRTENLIKETTHECPDPFADKVKCEECKCWIDKNDAQEIDCGLNHFSLLYDRITKYYCQAHRKPYDSMRITQSENIYFRTMSVDINGEPIGYIKIKNNK